MPNKDCACGGKKDSTCNNCNALVKDLTGLAPVADCIFAKSPGLTLVNTSCSTELGITLKFLGSYPAAEILSFIP